MKTIIKIFPVFLLFFTTSCSNDITELTSPDGKISLSFALLDGKPIYTVNYQNKCIIDTSSLGFQLKDMKALDGNFELERSSHANFSEIWKPLWGESSEITNKYCELLLELVQKDDQQRKLNIRFRVFDDGIGFRYEFPAQENLKDFVITDELSEFKLKGDHNCWWIPADYDSYEYSYNSTKLSEIDSREYNYYQSGDRHIMNPKAVNTPITMQTADNLFLSIHEAALIDYADMTLEVKENNTLKADLCPWPDGSKVHASAPFNSPWRTVLITKTPGELVTSNLILNLNEPTKLNDVSWIEPMKYIGIWWEMHIGKSSWGRGKVQGSWSGLERTTHGATTENTKKYIDFASASGIKGVLIEGWNTGWEYWGVDTTGFFDFITPYDDFDIYEVVRYAKEKGVEIVGHHETAGDVENYDKRLEAAFAFYNKIGIRVVKTGYAGPIRPVGYFHHSQYMVRHYHRVVETAAKYKIMIDAHEPIKDTGERRTFPNFMTREGVRGTEYEAWSEGNSPEHTTILPFTRGLAGPIDYTPGIFDLTFDKYKKTERVHTTLAKQLALYVTLYSPLNMAADLPENYKGNLAFEFIKEVPVTWDETKVLDAKIGDYIITARRLGDEWYIGAITDENEFTSSISLDFLNPELRYNAKIFSDGDDVNYDTNPTSIKIEQKEVIGKDRIHIKLAVSGGTAIILKPVK